MCILSYLPPGTAVDEDGLFNGGISNPDGHGWAIAAGEAVIMGKSLDLVEALDKFVEARGRYLDGPALFHSRWATHGSVRVGNVHPFVVGGSHRTVVAHNGILPSAARPGVGDDRSDSRKFADEILPRRFRRLDRRNVQRALAQWCGKNNKLVILTVDRRYRRNVYVVNGAAGQWDTETGIWHSNGDYLDYPRWLHTSAPDWPADAVTDELCVLCGYGVVDRSGYCDECRSCQDCLEPARCCMCWNRNGLAV
jgi:glutamine amidotransferase